VRFEVGSFAEAPVEMMAPETAAMVQRRETRRKSQNSSEAE
jgi:hypothetical protein